MLEIRLQLATETESARGLEVQLQVALTATSYNWLAGIKEGDTNDPHFDREDFAIALDMLPGNTAPGPDGLPADHNVGHFLNTME